MLCEFFLDELLVVLYLWMNFSYTDCNWNIEYCDVDIWLLHFRKRTETWVCVCVWSLSTKPLFSVGQPRPRVLMQSGWTICIVQERLTWDQLFLH